MNVSFLLTDGSQNLNGTKQIHDTQSTRATRVYTTTVTAETAVVYTIGPERRVYAKEASDITKNGFDRGGVKFLFSGPDHSHVKVAMHGVISNQ